MKTPPAIAVFGVLRRSRLGVVVLALSALLCAQAALAFYRCPQLASSAAASAQTPCEQMDRESPALCKAFMQGDRQGFDSKRPAIDFAAAAPVHALVLMGLPLPMRRRHHAGRRAPPRTRPPPLWIALGRFRD